MPIFFTLLTYFDFASVLLHYINTYDTHSFLLLYPNFHVFSAFIAKHLRQIKTFLVDLMTRFTYSMIQQSVGYCWVKIKVMNPFFFLMNPFLFF